MSSDKRVIIEGFCAKRAYIAFRADFHFYRIELIFGRLTYFDIKKHRSVIVFVNLRFVFEKYRMQKNSVSPGGIFSSLFLEQETEYRLSQMKGLILGKLTANDILNTDLDLFHSLAHCWKKICPG